MLLAGHLPEPDHLLRNDSRALVAIQNFLTLVEQLRAHPLAHVAYLREAYVDPVIDSVRVTLDRAVRSKARHAPVFSNAMQNPSLPFGERVHLQLNPEGRFRIPGVVTQLSQAGFDTNTFTNILPFARGRSEPMRMTTT